jgi:medium-chain acyl-[acyl-carrier-protein] hydrolase
MEINQLKRIYRKEIVVPFFDVDYRKRMKVSVILREFSQIAGEDYATRGMTHHFLASHGGMFLVSRIACRILRYPIHEQRLVVSTWEPERRGPQFIRSYDMKDGDGNLLAEAESGWLYVEVETKRITRPRDFPWPCPLIDKGTGIHISKLKIAEGPRVSEHTVAYSDMDANGHLYNATYGDLITNALPHAEYERDVSEIRINYVREAKHGDLVAIFREDTDDGVLLTGKVENAVCFESKLVFRA